MQYRAPRGTVDILPQEQAYWRHVEQRAASLCALYGYGRIDTPVFEDTRLFLRGIGEETDIVQKETYTFKDRGNSLITLRPEGTAPVCRAYVEHGMHSLPQPVKLYYLCPIFRYERPQAGRYRQHQQFGCEALGDADPALDAEVIDLAWRLLANLGLSGITLQLNSIGCRTCRPEYLRHLREYYAPRVVSLCPDCRRRLQTNTLRLLDCKNQACLALGAEAPRSSDHLCPDCHGHFEEVQRYLTAQELPYQLNHRLVRGLDYYTKTVFELQPEGEEAAQSTVGGGGRYDNLIEELGGRPTPAVGFAAGIERIILNLKKQQVPVPDLPCPTVFLAYVGDEAKEQAVRHAAQMRAEGIGAVVAGGARSLKAQLRQANAVGAAYTFIIGDEELRAGKVVLRDLAQASQQALSFREALVAIKSVARPRV